MSRTQAHGAPCVLIVEDEEPLVRLIGDYLRRDGFAVQASGDGAEAVDLAGAHDPTVVILDLGAS